MTEEKLYGEDVGERIKIAAVVFLVLEIIGSLICAFTFGIYRGWYGTTITAAFWLFLIIGPIVGYFTSLLIYGFGEMIHMSIETRSLLYKVNDKMNSASEQK